MSNPNWRDFFPDDLEIVEIESSNATESNRPGTGRVLGNIYERFGRRVESFLNGVAERMDLGPRAISVRINNRAVLGRQRAVSLGDLQRIAYTEEEARHQKKDLKKLIRHTKFVAIQILKNINCFVYTHRSSTDATREQALDGITNFAFLDEQPLVFLKSLRATQIIESQEAHIWNFCEASVQISSRMALACLHEQQLFQLVKRCGSDFLHVDLLMDFMRYFARRCH